MRPVGPDVPTNVAILIRELQRAVAELQNPTQPQQDAVVATSADLPPAAENPNKQIIVTASNALAISTNVAGTWTWLRADGSAL